MQNPDTNTATVLYDPVGHFTLLDCDKGIMMFGGIPAIHEFAQAPENASVSKNIINQLLAVEGGFSPDILVLSLDRFQVQPRADASTTLHPVTTQSAESAWEAAAKIAVALELAKQQMIAQAMSGAPGAPQASIAVAVISQAPAPSSSGPGM